MTENPFLSEKKPNCPKFLLDLAKAKPAARTGIVRAGSTLPMQAAKQAQEEGIMLPVLIGEPEIIRAEASKIDWDISGLEIVEAAGEEASAAKGAELANSGEIDVVMKGQLHTDVFMGALVRRETGIRTNERMVHVFCVTEPDTGRPFIISDGAVNVSPNLETRKTSLEKVVQMAKAIGIARPRIAILSATETPIESVPSSMEAKALCDWGTQNIPDADIRGPLALDLILSQKSAETKKLGEDPVAGKADGVIVPDIVSGNALFKAMVYLSGGCAGGIVLGGKIPVLLTSRADPPAARLASCALASIMRS